MWNDFSGNAGESSSYGDRDSTDREELKCSPCADVAKELIGWFTRVLTLARAFFVCHAK